MKNWSLNQKIASIVVLFVVACGIIAGVAISNMAKMEHATMNIAKNSHTRVVNYLNLRGTARESTIQTKNVELAETPEEMKKFIEENNKLEEKFYSIWDQAYAMATAEGKIGLDKVKKEFKELVDQGTLIEEAMLKGDHHTSKQISIGGHRKARKELETSLGERIEANQKMIESDIEETEHLIAQARTLMIIAALVAIALGSAIAWYVMKQLSAAIDKVISDLNANSHELSSAADSIASSSEELSQAASEQAASLQETVSSIEEISSMIAKNSENSKSAASMSGDNKNKAERGRVVVGDMIKAIGDISDGNTKIMHEITESNKRISEIVTVIGEIGNKTKVINDIVFQTKLLSFNASVEAARAGEQGKGFAVVAEEVGNLAQMSGNAAKEISTLLEGSIKKVEGIVADTKTKVTALIEEGKGRVDTGVKIANQCGEVLEDIVKSVTNVTNSATDIATASEEQAQGVQEINKAMGQLDQVTQQNSAASQATAGAAEQVARQAESMTNIIGILTETIRGSNGAAAPTQTAQVHHTPSRTATAAKHAAPKSVTHAAPAAKKNPTDHDDLPKDNHPGFKEV